ncbi:Na+/H+ antiporter NhaA [Aureimonas leprariae]|uniref:Na(+)/H(+) antiporter NhaA n=1 Tax=Plantimonas leprariae TaxID=2615207 RepID=A0A7V7TXU4_9HYPH|nr:Na+/H+ antiporter NhaA [Aureimonas leprariae]KAB0681381.1 Na+/H+ antiporter NhaA [Aureimonas leprariae]
MSERSPLQLPFKWPPGFLRRFVASEASGGLVLMAAAAVALLVANSPLAETYFAALHAHVGGLSVLHWINDALMAVFFLLVGLEIKREALEGQLSTWPARVLPGLAALGGMAAPAFVYVALNAGSPETLRGWAIPSATDIAFALGVLSLLGPRVPPSLKVFLAALAIIDDLGAVLIIAIFYTNDLNAYALLGAAAVTAALVAMNRLKVMRLAPYLALGAVLWGLVFLSGIHATLAGVVLAMTIPLRIRDPGLSPLFKLEHAIQPWVAYAIVPIFGFANAGVSFAGFSVAALLDPVPLGIAAGLFIGKQVGVFGTAWLATKAGWTAMPDGATWRQLYGVALLCGIGFTMSLFIGLLAFPTSPHLQDEVKLGVLMGSVLSGIVGAAVMATVPSRTAARTRRAAAE